MMKLFTLKLTFALTFLFVGLFLSTQNPKGGKTVKWIWFQKKSLFRSLFQIFIIPTYAPKLRYEFSN